MPVKKINEENIISIKKKIKKIPMLPTKTSPKFGYLTKKELIEQIKKMPDDTPIIIPSCDHTYIPARLSINTALFSPSEILEDFGEELTSEKTYGKRQDAIIIS